jgi:folate-binding protein YgfZ
MAALGERPLEDLPLAGAAVTWPLPRAVWVLSGDRPLGYLHDVLAQDVAGLAPGCGALAAALDPKGHLAAEVRVLPRPDGRVVLDADPEARAGVEARIGRLAPLAGCRLEEAGGWEAATVRGPATDEALAAAGLPVPSVEEAAVAEAAGEGAAGEEAAGEGAAVREAAGLLLVRVVWGVPGVDLLGPADRVRAAMRRLGLPALPWEALEAARVAAGRPRFGPDLSEELLVNETPLLARAVSLAKGCYPGQESVARVHNLGRVRRLLRGLRAEGPGLAAGAEVTLDGVRVGRVTSAAPADGGSVAIALLASDVAPGRTVSAAGVRATVVELP